MLTSLELPPTLLEQLQQFGMDLLDALDASRAVAASRTPKGREAAATRPRKRRSTTRNRTARTTRRSGGERWERVVGERVRRG